MSYLARSQPLDYLSMDQSARDEGELIRPTLSFDIFDGEERRGQKEGEDYGNDNENGRQPQ